MAERDDINKLYDKMEAIGINVGGCAVLYDKEKTQYYLVEHPVDEKQPGRDYQNDHRGDRGQNDCQYSFFSLF